jgi:4-hydroxyphenylpyruvate dioxygenase-like putative hemolysin
MFLLIRRCVHIAINGISRRYVPGPQFFPLALARAKAGVKVVDSAIVKGKKTSYEVRLALSQQGPVQLELIEYQSGDTVQKDFLDEKGEGIHHILFRVNDLEATLEKFAAQGVKVLQ